MSHGGSPDLAFFNESIEPINMGQFMQSGLRTNHNLVGGIPTPLKIWVRQLGFLFPLYGKIKNVPNHQPEMPRIATTQLLTMAQMNTHDASWWTVAVVNTFSVPKVLGPGKSCLLNVALGDRIHDGTARIQLKKTRGDSCLTWSWFGVSQCWDF